MRNAGTTKCISWKRGPPVTVMLVAAQVSKIVVTHQLDANVSMPLPIAKVGHVIDYFEPQANILTTHYLCIGTPKFPLGLAFGVWWSTPQHSLVCSLRFPISMLLFARSNFPYQCRSEVVLL